MNTDHELLARRVATRNLVNAKANELQAEFRNLLAPWLLRTVTSLPFIDKKVVKVMPYSTWTKQVAQVLDTVTSRPDFAGPHTGRFRLVYNFCAYSVYAEIDTTYRIDEHSVNYVKQEFCVCRLDGNCDGVTLTSLPDLANFRTDYTAEEIIEKRAKLAELQAELRAVESELREFR
jgi:hypothetical protein